MEELEEWLEFCTQILHLSRVCCRCCVVTVVITVADSSALPSSHFHGVTAKQVGKLLSTQGVNLIGLRINLSLLPVMVQIHTLPEIQVKVCWNLLGNFLFALLRERL